MSTRRFAALYVIRPWWHKPLVWTAWLVAFVMTSVCGYVVLVRADVVASLDGVACGAAASGEAWKVRLALVIDPRLADMAWYDSWRWSPLHKAAMGGHARIVEDLVEAGANVNHLGSRRWTPLHEAAWRGHVDVMETLARRGAVLDVTDDEGMTPLTWAIIAGRRRAASWLAARGARGDEASPEGMTAVYAATRLSDHDMLKIALTSVRDVDRLSEDGITALHRAAFSGDARKVRLLLERGANPNARSREWEPVRMRPRVPEPPDVADDEACCMSETIIPCCGLRLLSDGATPLHCAAACGSQEIAGMLLDRGADASAKTDGGQTAAEWAAQRGYRRLARTLTDAARERAPVTSSSRTSGGST